MTTQQTLGRFGNYELIEPLGRGGMGVVYKARQQGLDRLVAVKTILNSQFQSPKDLQRFRVEARAAAKLNHPGIVSIHEIGDHEGQPYYSMDFVDGPTLATLLSAGTLPSREAARLTLQLAEAVSHAHLHDVLHRDLKPSNILIDRSGSPRISAFGLAKCIADASDLTMSGQVLGTPNYMSPEQALGQVDHVGPASDVYGLGAVLYAAITGVAPFRAANAPEVLRRVIDELPAPPRQLNAAVDPDLETICLRCLEKRPSDRYGSAQELADDLSRYLEGYPIQARPYSFARVAWHWARRPQRLRQVTATVFLIAAFFAMWTTLGAFVIVFKPIQLNNRAEGTFLVALDLLTFLLTLTVAFGVKARNRWMMKGGIVVGVCIVVVNVMMFCTGYEGGGFLQDPFHRITMHTVFGLAAILLASASAVALISHQSQPVHEPTSVRSPANGGEFTSSTLLATMKSTSREVDSEVDLR